MIKGISFISTVWSVLEYRVTHDLHESNFDRYQWAIVNISLKAFHKIRELETVLNYTNGKIGLDLKL